MQDKTKCPICGKTMFLTMEVSPPKTYLQCRNAECINYKEYPVRNAKEGL